MKGTIISVNVSEEKGEKKHNVGTCRLLTGKGLTGGVSLGDELEVIA